MKLHHSLTFVDQIFNLPYIFPWVLIVSDSTGRKVYNFICYSVLFKINYCDHKLIRKVFNDQKSGDQ